MHHWACSQVVSWRVFRGSLVATQISWEAIAGQSVGSKVTQFESRGCLGALRSPEMATLGT
jgi:hypothetical protein